ncbi:MAG TPA: ABC transporter permease [Chloroflexota bacterium]|nr:ABC transporter permease [Chloroflexota bacterium]
MAQPSEPLPSQSYNRDAQRDEAGGAVLVAATEAEAAPRSISSPMRDAWRRFRHNWAAMISLIIILILIVMSIFAPLMHTSDPMASDFTDLNAFPSWHHWFGTDGLGRDTYSRLVYGMRVTFVVGIVGAAITTILGMLLGVISGYFGGIVDALLARFTDLMFAFPSFILALIIISFYGSWANSLGMGGAGRVVLLVIVFAIVGWPGLMRFVRSLVLSMKEQQFIEAARTVGTGSWAIMIRHLLPNTYGLVLVQASFIVIGFIGTEAVLSLLGLGVQAPNPDLGVMLSQGASVLDLNYWEVLAPAIVLAILILTFTFLGDGVRDAVDPRTKG